MDRSFLEPDSEFRKAFVEHCRGPAEVGLPIKPKRPKMPRRILAGRPKFSSGLASPFRGVSPHRDFNRARFRWAVRVKIGGLSVYLGEFEIGEAERAARLFDRVKYRVTGKREYLNFPDDELLDRIVPDGKPIDPLCDQLAVPADPLAGGNKDEHAESETL